jgi:tetratricopeptide (TPR) repeat protein
MPIQPRTRQLFLLLALAIGCKRDGTVSPDAVDPPSGDVMADGKTETPTEGDGPSIPGGIDPSIEENPAQPREREKPADPQTRDAALVAVAHGNPDGAVRFLLANLKPGSTDHEGLFALARGQRLIGQLDASEQTLTNIHKSAKDDAIKTQALRGLARLRFTRGDIKQAEQHIRAARKLAPDDLLLKGELVRIMFLTGRAADSETRQLIDELYAAYSDGSAQSAGELLGAAYAGLAEQAFKSASRVLQEAEHAAPPANGSELGDEISMVLVDLFLEKYKPEEAAATIALVLERDPWNPEALAKMGWVFLDQFGLAAASRTATEALQVNPENADAHAVLAWIALIEGDRAAARRHIVDHVVNVNPSHQGGQIVLAALAIFDRDKVAYGKARDAVLGFDPRDGRFFSKLSDLLGYLHLYPEADAVLVEGAKLLPDDPYVQGALGLSKLRLGDELAGRAALDKAWKKDKYNERTLNVRELYNERIEPHYAERVEADLTLRVPAELQDMVAPGYVAAITAARKGLDKGYGIKISPLRIEMYREPDEFSVRTVGVPSLGAIGVCFGPVITSLGPYMGTHNFNQVIWHEIAHSYAIELSDGRVPRWFTEGLSEWESEVADPSWARESAELLFEARRHDKLRKLSELELAFLRAESPLMMEVAYATAAWAMRYLGTTYGRPKIVALLEGYATGKSTDELFKQILGKDLATVEKDFSKWFDAELDRKLTGWRPSQDQQDDPRLVALMKALEVAGQGDYAQAQKLLEKLIAEKGDGFHTRTTLAAVLSELGDHQGAIAQYEKAASFSLESIEPFVGIAKIARQQKNVTLEIDQIEKLLAIDAMSLDPVLRMLVLAATVGDPRLAGAVERGVAISPLHPSVLAGGVLLLHAKKSDKKRTQAMLDHVMTIALRPDASLDVVVMAALAADAVGDARVKDLAPRALLSEELPDPARKKLSKHAP